MIDAFSLGNSIESADASDLLAKASGVFFERDIVQAGSAGHNRNLKSNTSNPAHVLLDTIPQILRSNHNIKQE